MKVGEVMEISQKAEEYLRKFIQETQQQDVWKQFPISHNDPIRHALRNSYPFNLVLDLYDVRQKTPESIYQKLIRLTEDQYDGLVVALSTLNDRRRDMLLGKYRDHKTKVQIAKEFHVSPELVHLQQVKALEDLRHPSRFLPIVYGLKGNAKLEDMNKSVLLSELDQVSMLNVPKRVYNALHKAGYETIIELNRDIKNNTLQHTHSLGEVGYMQIIKELHRIGMLEETIYTYPPNDMVAFVLLTERG